MFTSYTGTDMPNLDSILENYGVKRSSGIVVETDSQHYYPQMPYYLLPNIQSDDITTEVKSNYILMPVAQAIQKLDSYRDTITIKSLLTTTEDAYIEMIRRTAPGRRARTVRRAHLTLAFPSQRP